MTYPQINRTKAHLYLAFAMKAYNTFVISPEHSMYVLGVRGYYLDSKGKPGANDRNIYDDAIVVCSPAVTAAFNANCDPSAWRKGVASLRPGIHFYKPGNHGITRPGGGYPAFRPATRNEELPVDRDGVPDPAPGVAINIHKGAKNSTSSLGCQTIYPEQWDSFYALVMGELKRAGMKHFPYVLVDEVAFRKEGK